MNEEEKILNEQFKKLPKDAQALLLSSSFQENIKLLRLRYDISIDKEVMLQNEITLLILGLVDPDEFIENLIESSGITREEALLLARDVNSLILSPVRPSLQAFYQSEQLKTEEKRSPSEMSTTKKVEPPSNLPVIEPHLEPVVVEKEKQPFLPPLRKNPAQIPSTPFQKPAAPPPTYQTKKSEMLPDRGSQTRGSDMSSALAAEIGNLLNKKESLTRNTPPNFETATRKEGVPQQTSSIPRPIAPTPKPETPKATAPTPQRATMPAPASLRPEDKMSSMVQKPRVEAEMIQRAPETQKPKKSVDPYREPIE